MNDFYDYLEEWSANLNNMLNDDSILLSAIEGTEADNDKKDDDAGVKSNAGADDKNTDSPGRLSVELRAGNSISRIFLAMKKAIVNLVKNFAKKISEKAKARENAKWEENNKKFIADLEAKKSDPGFQNGKLATFYHYDYDALVEGINGCSVDAFGKLKAAWNEIISKLDHADNVDVSEEDYEKMFSNVNEDLKFSEEESVEKIVETAKNAIRGPKIEKIITPEIASWAESAVRKTPNLYKTVSDNINSMQKWADKLEDLLDYDFAHNGNKNIAAPMQKLTAAFSKVVQVLITMVSACLELIDESYVQATKILDLVYTKDGD